MIKRDLVIIQTMPYMESDDSLLEFIHNCNQCGVTIFRFNLAKIYSKKEFEVLTEKLHLLRCKEPNSKIILDLPYPYKKIRLFHEDKVIHVTNGTLLELSNNPSIKSDGYINVESLKDYFSIHKKYYHNEGIGEFFVEELSDNKIVLRALGEFDLFSSKAITSDRLIYDDTHVATYSKLINKYKIDQIWFSFVDNLEMIDIFMKQIRCKSDVFLKIETQSGVNHLNQLLQSDYNIVVARGDLAMNVYINDFFDIQNTIIKYTQKAEKMVYVGTDILPSMSNRIIPARAELIDLLSLKQYGVDGIMLNVGLLYGKYYKKVIELISR